MTNVYEETVPVTPEEKEQILRHALGLIREPESWVSGQWKCPAWEISDRGSVIVGKQKEDANGKKLYQYCVHGALNQATYDVLGKERAEQLGAISRGVPLDNVEAFNGGDSEWGVPATWLGIDRLASELYYRAAMPYNDAGMDYSPPELEEHHTLNQHQGVLHILRTRLSEFGK